nr:hypothetical protein OJOKFFHK_00034 [uncultured bacterium]
MLGTIGFKSYCINCVVGTESHERTTLQDLFVDLRIVVDFNKVVNSGKLEDTVNYVTLAEICRDIAINGKYHLLEKYASDVMKELFYRFPVVSAWIRVEKPSAIPGAVCSFVELEQESR